MLLCEGDNIEDKLTYAEDLVDFLVEQVGPANVEQALTAPPPANQSSTVRGPARSARSTRLPLSARGPQAERFHIGDVEEPLRRKESSKRRHSMPSAENMKLFFIGDLKAVKERHSTQSFFIGDGKPKSSSSTKAHSKERTPTAAYPGPRLVCKNLLADDSDASTTDSESHSPISPQSPRATAAAAEQAYSTPVDGVKRLLEFATIPAPPPRQSGDWTNWAYVLGCAARDRE